MKENTEFKVKVVSKVKVKPISSAIDLKPEDIKSSDINIKNLYPNILICSKKASGKSVLVYNIMKKMINKHTIVFIFCPSYERDNSWITIIDYLKKKNNQYFVFTDIGSTLDTIIRDINTQIEEGDLPSEDEESEITDIMIKDDNKIVLHTIEEEIPNKKYIRKPKRKSPEYLMIFDDMSREDLRSKSLSNFLIRNRHSKTATIISTQYVHFLPPSSLKNMDIFICFKSFSKEKLEVIKDSLDISFNFDLFWRLYKFCTDEKYDFMMIDVKSEDIYKTFRYRIELDETRV